MIIIQGDERTPHGQLVQIMDTAHQAGLVGVYQGVATEPQPEEAKGAAEANRDEHLFMVVDQEGNMKLNDKPVTFATLKEELRAKRQLLDNTTIIIQHDERAPHGQIVQIMDIVHQVGLVGLVSDELKTPLLEFKPGNTTIAYKITAGGASAELAIYNVAGQPVRTFVLGHRSPGKYHIVWDGRDDAGRELSKGMYFYKLQTDAEATDKSIFGKMILK